MAICVNPSLHSCRIIVIWSNFRGIGLRFLGGDNFLCVQKVENPMDLPDMAGDMGANIPSNYPAICLSCMRYIIIGYDTFSNRGYRLYRFCYL